MLSRILGLYFELKRIGLVRLDPEHSSFIRLDRDHSHFEVKSKSIEITAGELDGNLTVGNGWKLLERLDMSRIQSD